MSKMEVKEGVRKMKDLDKNKTGLIVGTFVGALHALWSIMVAVGLAQAYLDWILGLHFLDNPYMVAEFNLITAVMLVAVVFVCGYLAGYLFAFIWNTLREK